MPKLILNAASLLLALLINYLSNKAILASQTIGEVSRKYDTLFTPASYAFSIWGWIYFLLLAFVSYQAYCRFSGTDSQADRMGYWFVITNIANALWVWCWVNEYTGLSVLVMALLLFSLIRLVQRLDMELYDAPLTVILFVWWPLCFYFGWVVLATVVNATAFLVSAGWEGGPLSPVTWTIILIIISAGIYMLLIYKRNLREAALTGVWGVTAIAIRQWESHSSIVLAALLMSGILLVYTGMHGYRNRATSPWNKWKER